MTNMRTAFWLESAGFVAKLDRGPIAWGFLLVAPEIEKVFVEIKNSRILSSKP